VDGAIGFVLSLAHARFAAAELALLDLGGGDGESRALFCHDGSVVIACGERNGALLRATTPRLPRCAA
jgi:hypothetical protein